MFWKDENLIHSDDSCTVRALMAMDTKHSTNQLSSESSSLVHGLHDLSEAKTGKIVFFNFWFFHFYFEILYYLRYKTKSIFWPKFETVTSTFNIRVSNYQVNYRQDFQQLNTLRSEFIRWDLSFVTWTEMHKQLAG